jgi:HlyD family secretion protein
MTRIHHIIPALIAATAHAGELTMEMKPFSVTHSFTATALPDASQPISLDAEAWTDFSILSIKDHGSSVKKGEALVVFDAEEIDRKITDTRQAIATATLGLAQAELDLATLGETVPKQLARLKRNADQAAEELAYFTATRRKASEEAAAQSLKRNEQLLSSKKEELKQLLKMYEADDITEDTEEIILQQQKDSVAYAEFALRMEILDHKRTLAVSLPRETVALTEKRDDTALLLEKGEKDLPRSLELKKLELGGLKTSLSRNRQALADLENDRSLFGIKAPADGTFYHGAIETGKWTTGELIKELRVDGSAPVKKAFATFIPSAAKMEIHAFLDQATAAVVAPGATGAATLPGHGEIVIPVTLSEIGSTPNPDQTYSATFTAAWPEKTSPAAGQALEINLVSYATEKALAIPSKALEYGPKGWTVEVKLADGKTEKRAVTKGRSSGEETEIAGGLEAGQVVIVP